jgi:hypothetical protein
MKKQIVLSVKILGRNYTFTVRGFQEAFALLREFESAFGRVSFRFETFRY